MTSSDHVFTQIDGDIGTVTIDRPEQLNALNTKINDDLRAAFAELEGETNVVILRTEGDRAFVAGADLEEIADLTNQEFMQFQKNGRATNDAIAAHDAQVIAAVDGLAYGGGFELALAADMIVAETGAKFAVPEIKLGLLPGGGATQRLSRIVGTNKAKEMLVTGQPISAEEAEILGLVNRLVEDAAAETEARDLAETIVSRAPIAVREAKRVVDQGIEAPLPTALSYEQEVTYQLFDSRDAKEGIEAFIDDREPEFEGR
jgi:enoyl-CoA hydratase